MKKIIEGLIFQLRKNPERWGRWKVRFYRLASALLTITFLFFTEGVLNLELLSEEVRSFLLFSVAVVLGVDTAANILVHETVKSARVLERVAKKDKKGNVLNPQTGKPFESVTPPPPPSPFDKPKV